MKPLCLFLAFVAAAAAAVDGTVLNQTTGKPQGGAVVTLYRLGQAAGMQPITTVLTDAQGRFRIAQDAEGPRLLQAVYDGVVYNQVLSPGAQETGITLAVFNSANQPDLAKLTSHFLVFQPSGGQMTVTEGFIFRNDGKATYNDPKGGTLRFHLPPAAQGNVKVQVTAPQGMPIERPANKTGKPGVYAVDFPVKPGETRFELTYSVAFAAPAEFAGKVLYPNTPTSLVAPPGVEIQGKDLSLRGQEPRSQATVYETKAADFKVQVSGAMRASEESDAASGEPSVEQVMPRLYDSLPWLLALCFAILSLGFVLLYRARLVEAAPVSPSGSKKGANERRRR